MRGFGKFVLIALSVGSTSALLSMGQFSRTVAAAEAMPKSTGRCVITAVKTIGSRLQNTPGSGSTISYTNGGVQVFVRHQMI